MQMNEVTTASLEAAARDVGDGPVVMVNLLWFRDKPEYPPGFEAAKPDVRSAYYEGYAFAFRAVAQEVGVSVEVVHAGARLNSVLAEPDEDWDEIALVRYNSFADLRKIIESESYARLANPHRLAAIANWRFFATRAR